ncbi:hypothetical protein NMG60_11034727 [Bertholletia excelsa]
MGSINPPPIKTQQSSALPISSDAGGFPILAVAVLCIVATAFLLVSYYLFLNKCCLINWQQLDPLRRFSMPRTRPNDDPLIPYSPSLTHGLDEFLIREIPTVHYTKLQGEERSLYKCVVCLSDFQEQDILRVLPKCGHGFHLDCIDVWLQSNSNCPLCRSSISGNARYPTDRLVAPTSSPQDPQPFAETHVSGHMDFVVIELTGTERTMPERSRSPEQLIRSPGRWEQRIGKTRTTRKWNRVSIMGDECIDVREKIEPIRRSFSMDSAADRHVYAVVQDIVRRSEKVSEVRSSEECGSSGGSSSRVKDRSFTSDMEGDLEVQFFPSSFSFL